MAPLSETQLKELLAFTVELAHKAGKVISEGSEAIAKRSLKIPDSSYLRGLYAKSSPSETAGVPCWLNRLFDERYAAVLIDVSVRVLYLCIL